MGLVILLLGLPTRLLPGQPRRNSLQLRTFGTAGLLRRTFIVLKIGTAMRSSCRRDER